MIYTIDSKKMEQNTDGVTFTVTFCSGIPGSRTYHIVGVDKEAFDDAIIGGGVQIKFTPPAASEVTC